MAQATVRKPWLVHEACFRVLAALNTMPSVQGRFLSLYKCLM